MIPCDCDYCGAKQTAEPIIVSTDIEPNANTIAHHYWTVAVQDNATHFCVLCGARYDTGGSWT